MHAVTSVTWIPRGVAKSCPEKLRYTKEDLKRLFKSHQDDEDEECNDSHGLSCNADEDDQYLSMNDKDSDEEDDEIKPEDDLIAVGQVKGDEFFLQAWVYNESENYNYCHHDYFLSDCPLSVEHVGYGAGEAAARNFVAVGMMSPNIEIWNFDVMNAVEPAMMLAGSKSETHMNPPSKKKKTISNGCANSVLGHTDSVLGLSWNRLQQQVLASASADSCIGIWDLDKNLCVLLRSLHSERVQTIQWHPCESQMLLSGSSDHYVKVVDCRNPESSQKSWKMSGEIEKVLWNKHNPCCFFASSNTGDICCYDIRTDNPLFKLTAHKAAVTGMTLSQTFDGCLVSSSEDQYVKVWDVQSSNPSLVDKKKLKMGSLFCVAACPESPLLLCVGGENEMRIMNMKNTESIVAHFSEIKGIWQQNQSTAMAPSDQADIQSTTNTTASETKKVVKKSCKEKAKKSSKTKELTKH